MQSIYDAYYQIKLYKVVLMFEYWINAFVIKKI